MIRVGLVMIVGVVAVSLGGCPESVDVSVDIPDLSTDQGSNSSQTAPGPGQIAPGQNGPTVGGELLGDGRFVVTLPAGLQLTQQDSPDPSVSYWRLYEDPSGTLAIAIKVFDETNFAVSNLENVTIRLKGALRSNTGDFLLIRRLIAESFFGFESEAAIGLLADGSILLVEVGSPAINGVDELFANIVFSSIDLAETDGSELEQRWSESAPSLLAKTDDDIIVLSDKNVWALYSNKSTEEDLEVDSWSIGDPIFSQVVSTNGGVEGGELFQIGSWRPVDVFKLGTATDSTITAIDNDQVTLDDGTRWVVGTTNASTWQVGDQIIIFSDLDIVLLIHSITGNTLVNPSRVIAEDGFSVTLPARSIEETDGISPPAGAEFWKTFYDPVDDISYAVAVFSDTVASTSIPTQQSSARLLGGITTSSSDFLLLARFESGGIFDGFEADYAIGQLADGRYLVVYMLANFIGTDEELAGFTLFGRIDLVGTDGTSLEAEIAADSPAVIANADNGMLVLDDLSVWSLNISPTLEETREFESWQVGDRVTLQTYTEFSFEKTELLHVGNWFPVQVGSENDATDLTITQVVDAETIRTSDGALWGFSPAIPAGWDVGDQVLRVDNDFFGSWLIHPETSGAIEFF